MMIKKPTILLCLILMGLQQLSAQSSTTHTYKVANGKSLLLDVYQPGNAPGRKSPVIILFHGGALVNGSRSQMKGQCAYFAAKGMVAVTADYRFLLIDSSQQKKSFNADRCIMDAKSAVRWVKQHAEQFGIDTNYVVLGGGSAGGFLATAAALNNTVNDASDDLHVSTKALALILYNPAYIPEARYAPAPANEITKKSPPAILFFGDQDSYKAGGDKFYGKLAQNGVKAEMWIAKGQTHAFYNREGWREATDSRAYNFLLSLQNPGISGVPEKDIELFPLTLQAN